MAGYATGELYFAAQTLGFRHSHLDTGAYSYDQKNAEKDVTRAVDFLIDDEPGRAFLTSMVGCLFARSVYTEELLAECLRTVGFDNLVRIRFLRLPSISGPCAGRFGPRPALIRIIFLFPKRFYQVKTWKGQVDKEYLDNLKKEYGRRIQAIISGGQ